VILKKILLISLACGIIFSGCASDVANRYYAKEKFPPRDPSTVSILTDKPAREFIVIADFQSRGESPADLQKKAASVGADAVIVSLLGGYYSLNEEWAGGDSYSKTYSRISGTAIKFK
jgi:hypothetical protein